LVGTDDVRAALRQEVTRLPDAPNYLVICVGATGAWPELEVGFAAIGAVIEASTTGLQGYVTTELSTEEQTGIRNAAGIPSADIPMAVVSLGRPSGSSDVRATESADADLGLSVEHGITNGADMTIHYTLPVASAVDLAVYDCLGRRLAMLLDVVQDRGPHTASWACRDDRGRQVLSGVYFCQLKAAGQSKTAQVVVVR
jgi:hypothetical protein